MKFFSWIDSIPLRVSFIISLIMIFTLLYLNYFVSDRFQQNYNSVIQDKRQFSSSALNEIVRGKDFLNSNHRFELNESLNRLIQGALIRVDIVDESSKIILSSSSSSDINKSLSQSLVNLLKEENAFDKVFDIKISSQANGKDALVYFSRLNSGGTRVFAQFILDKEIISSKTPILLFLGIVSIFLTIIVFVVVFLVLSRYSSEIKQISNAIESLKVGDFELVLPKSRDELGKLVNQLTDLKDIMSLKKVQIDQLEKNNDILKAKKFSTVGIRDEKSWVAEKCVFSIVRLNEILEVLEPLKMEVKVEAIRSLAEKITEIISPLGGSIDNFQNSDVYLRFQGENSLAVACQGVAAIRSRIPVISSHLDFSTQLTIRAVIKSGMVEHGALWSGSNQTKMFLGSTVQLCADLLNSIGKDDILLVEELGKPTVEVNKKRIKIVEAPSSAKNHEFYLLTDRPVQSEDSDKQGHKTPMKEERNGSTKKLTGLAAILEETLTH